MRYRKRIAADPDLNKKRWARRKDAHNAARRAWTATHKAEIRRWNLKAKFGKTPEEIDLMFAKQGKVCAICGEPPRDGVPRVDHLHGTKVIRGLLCDRCNAGIGMFLDDPHRLYKAMIYLTKAEETKLAYEQSIGDLPSKPTEYPDWYKRVN